MNDETLKRLGLGWLIEIRDWVNGLDSFQFFYLNMAVMIVALISVVVSRIR